MCIRDRCYIRYTAWLKRPNFWIQISSGSAETLARGGGITNHHLIAYSLSNISAKNYQNRLLCVKVIVCNISVVFLRHTVVLSHSESHIFANHNPGISAKYCSNLWPLSHQSIALATGLASYPSAVGVWHNNLTRHDSCVTCCMPGSTCGEPGWLAAKCAIPYCFAYCQICFWAYLKIYIDNRDVVM